MASTVTPPFKIYTPVIVYRHVDPRTGLIVAGPVPTR